MGIYVPWLVDACRLAAKGTDWTVVVWPGHASRGQGPMRLVEGVVGHHTGTPEKAPGDYPSANVVRLGRAGLVGMLSQLGLGRRKEIHVFGGGLAYHAGASAYAGYVDLNDEFIGIEAEDSGDGNWTAEALFMYPRLVGACLYYMRRGVDRYASHRTVARPPGRKPDPAGISDAWMRERAARFMANPHGATTTTPTRPEEDDMPSLDELLSTKLGKDGNTAFEKWASKPGTLGHWLRGQRQLAAGTRAMVTAQAATIDKLADLLAAGDNNLTAEGVKAAVAQAIAEGTVKVNIDVTGVQG